MKLDNYYAELGVDRGASLGALKRAFRVRLLSIHPDQNPQDQLASERTRKAIEAYKVLSSPAGIREYGSAVDEMTGPVAVEYGEVDAEVPRSVAKVVSAVVVIGFAIYLLVTLVASILANRTPVFTFCVATMPDTTEPRMLPQLLYPSISDCAEWYHTEQLQIGLVNRWLVGETMKVYSDAVRRAERQGDPDRARFYRTSMDGIRASDSNEVSGLASQPSSGPSPRAASAKGARRAFASS